jgi:outer membrane protein assembly factor BamB
VGALAADPLTDLTRGEARAMHPEWSWPVPGASSGSFLFAVAGHAISKVRGDERLTLTALSLDDGRVAWERAFEYDTVEIFFPFGSKLFLDGERARGLDAADGRTLAERDWGERVTVCWPIRSGPVYWLEESGVVVGLDGQTLDELWRWPDPEGSCLVLDDVLCRYDRDGSIEVVDLRTGVDRYRCQGPPRDERPISRGLWGHLLVQTYERRRVAIDLRTGAIAWDKQEDIDRLQRIAAFVDDTAYAGEIHLSAYDLATGDVRWRQTFAPHASVLGCNPVIQDGRIYGGTRNGLVFAVDPADGHVTSSFHVPYSVNGVTPAPGGRVIVGSSDQIECYRLPR